MNSSRSVGLLLIGLGVLAILAGLLVWSGALAWFGRLPGDIRYERGPTRVCFPITSMILVSVVLTLVLNLLRRFF
ncbi:MAG TPA: DUF2905 domain-containing protein [Blastocatellia bacterium]|nr:DUF2905 domain-containing protein [Blastocatellia bacterium]